MTDLRGLEQRVDRHEHATRGGRGETGDDSLEALVQVDGDPILPAEAGGAQAPCCGVDCTRQLA